MKKTFAGAVLANKAPSMRCGLSIISLEHSYGLNGSRIFDRTQLAPKCSVLLAAGYSPTPLAIPCNLYMVLFKQLYFVC